MPSLEKVVLWVVYCKVMTRLFATFAHYRYDFLLQLLAYFHNLTRIYAFRVDNVRNHLALYVNKSVILALPET